MYKQSLRKVHVITIINKYNALAVGQHELEDQMYGNVSRSITITREEK